MNEPALTLLKQLRNGNTLPEGARLLIAVSGGADSMALLHLYTRVRDELRLEIAAATFDHRLRGDIGHGDARFVEEAAAAWGVICFSGQARSTPPSKGTEAWARQARYAFLAETARVFGAQVVATAHHADDQAETVLANILRGTGGRGLGGMRPVSQMPGATELTLIRPLLNTARADLVAYCRAEGVAWRDDATNTDTRYRRNWLRHTVIPLLREANPGITGALARLASISAEEDDYLQAIVEEYMREHATVADGWVWLPRGIYMGWHTALQKRALLYAQRLVDADAEPDYERLQAASALAQTAEGGVIELGGGVDVEIDRGWVTISRHGAAWSPPYKGHWMIPSSESRFALRNVQNDREIHHLQLIKIRAPHDSVINVRSRRDGDRVYPRSLGGRSQKLKDWLINRKIPRQLRDYLPVIEAAGQIVAIWDGGDWETFSPPFPADTIEICLTLDH
jgi:tRNA(Ile)-lysidine synthase